MKTRAARQQQREHNLRATVSQIIAIAFTDAVDVSDRFQASGVLDHEKLRRVADDLRRAADLVAAQPAAPAPLRRVG